MTTSGTFLPCFESHVFTSNAAQLETMSKIDAVAVINLAQLARFHRPHSLHRTDVVEDVT
eukprot:2562644-Rhodomonas_salina.1